MSTPPARSWSRQPISGKHGQPAPKIWLRLPPSLHDAIARIAADEHTTRSAVMRQALELFVAEHDSRG